MTENEAIKILEERYLTMSMCGDIEQCKRNNQAISSAVTALTEIQQYRAIGTVEEIRAKMEELVRWHSDRLNSRIKNEFAAMSTLICHNCDHKDEYIEKLEAEIEEYKAIGTAEECREARERQRAKKYKVIEPCKSVTYYQCPCCDGLLHINENFCGDCGQAIDWSDTD